MADRTAREIAANDAMVAYTLANRGSTDVEWVDIRTSTWDSVVVAVLAALGIDPDTPLPLRIITQADDGDFRMAVCEVIDNAIYDLIDDEDSRIAKRIIPALAKAGLLAARLEEQ